MGLRLAKKKQNKNTTSKPSEEIKEDPRKIKEVAEWNRLRLVIYHESGHQAWGYPLYALHRSGKISERQREAGDAYFRVVQDYNRVQQIDIDAVPDRAKDFQLRRIKKAKERYQDALDVLGIGRKLVESLLFEHEYPATERQLHLLKACLEQLSILFGAQSE